MDVASPISKHSVGKTFVVAISILGVAAFIQLCAVCWVFVVRYHATSDIEPMEMPLLADEAGEETAVGKLIPRERSMDRESLPGDKLSQPTPIPQGQREISTEARLVELVQQARSLRERGDTSTALTRLREAQTISPRSALITSEVAITFEKMGQTARAYEEWRKIYDLGESAGIYFAAAKAKLGEGVPQADPMTKSINGIQAGMSLGIGSIEQTPIPDVNATEKFTLRIPLKARPSLEIDVRDVVIQVYFYDIIGGQDIVQTNANVRSHWSTLPADWSDDDIEILEVEYMQPKPSEGDQPVETRKYHGYIVRLYYKGDLQDMRARPVDLLKQFPPPTTLPTD